MTNIHVHIYCNDQSANVSWAFTISQALYTVPLSAVDKQHSRDFNKVISLKAKVKLSTDHISKSVHGKRKEVSSRIWMRRERELHWSGTWKPVQTWQKAVLVTRARPSCHGSKWFRRHTTSPDCKMYSSGLRVLTKTLIIKMWLSSLGHYSQIITSGMSAGFLLQVHFYC